MTIADQLRAAADVLRRDGWIQGRCHNRSNAHCVVGALVRICPRPFELAEVCGVLATVLQLPNGARDLVRWNDDPANSAANMILALEFAALWWEQAQAQTAPAEQVEMS